MTLRTEVVSDPMRFESLRVPWERLWDCSDSYIFQRHDWLAGWFSALGRDAVKLQIALAWDGDRLCGAMPCAVHRRSGLRVLTWAGQLFSDYCDCLLDPADDAANVLALLWDCLRQFGGYDLISLQQIRSDARCQGFLDRLVETNKLQSAHRTERCMRVDNQWPDGDAFFRSLNKKGRNNHTRGKRILAELSGDVRFRVVEAPDTSGPLLIDQIMRLKQEWLRANDPQSALLGDEHITLRSVIDSAWMAGLAKIFVLECGEKIVALSVNFVYAGRMLAYFTAYDGAYERASPGTILIVDYLRWAFDRGFTHVDFLRGEEAFKFRLANAETVLTSFSGSRTLLGQLAVIGHRWLSRRRQHQTEIQPPLAGDELQATG